MICETCFRRCEISEGRTGFCGARKNEGGKIVAENYGRVTALALDPIEKKPFARFFPGTKILSVGSYGCNLNCPFCQNYSISKEFGTAKSEAVFLPPQALVEKALELKSAGNIGLAFTYNEPLVGWEYVLDTARLSREAGMKNALVTNGSEAAQVLEKLLPFIDAMNIDLKAFSAAAYKKLGGDFDTVKTAIKLCAAKTHVEITTLIVPVLNDSPDEMREETKWISSIDKNIPLHLTRFFPRYKFAAQSAPTPIPTLRSLAEIAREFLPNVILGNC